MKLSTKSRYGTRLILDLANHYEKGAVQLSEIAGRQGISQKYLEQILKPLRKEGIVKSVRGAKGGYVLGRHPSKISVGEIVALLEGGTMICECTENAMICERADSCLTRDMWTKAAKALFDELYAVSFLDLVRRQNRKTEIDNDL